MHPTSGALAARDGESGREARALRRRRAARRRAFWITSTILAATLILGSRLTGDRVQVNGRTVRVGRTATVADCARRMGLAVAPHNLLDVEGEVLQAGAGTPATAWLNGAAVELTASTGSGDEVRITPAAHVREPITDRVTYLYSPCVTPAGEYVPGSEKTRVVRGIRRERRGAISGKQVSSETTRAHAVVYPPGSPDTPRTLAVTFDDGPNSTWTPRVLDVLHAHGARGTFFVLGQAVKPISGVYHQILAGGHEVGTHSWRHDDFTKLSSTAARADLQRCLSVMKEEGATAVRWFRPPWGAVSKRVEQDAAAVGLKIALWDVDPYDWKRPGTDVIYSRVMETIKNRAVILFHDGPGDRTQTIQALERLLKDLRGEGYHFVTMSEARGLVPVFTGEVLLKAQGLEWRLRPLPPRTRVIVNGSRVDTPLPPLTTGADLLVPAQPILAALGHQGDYHAPTETLTVRAGRAEAVLRLNSLAAEIDGQEISLPTPAVLHTAGPFVPLSVLKRIADVSCVLDQERWVLTITTTGSAPPAAALSRPPVTPPGPRQSESYCASPGDRPG